MSPDTVTPAFKRPLTWLVPVAAVSIIMSLLAALYLGGILDPRENLRHFPVALVVSDEGDVLPNGQQANIGEQIATGIVDCVDPEKIDLRRVGIADAQNNGAVTVYHSSDLSNANAIDTALVLLSGVNITQLTAANFVV